LPEEGKNVLVWIDGGDEVEKGKYEEYGFWPLPCSCCCWVGKVTHWMENPKRPIYD